MTMDPGQSIQPQPDGGQAPVPSPGPQLPPTPVFGVHPEPAQPAQPAVALAPQQPTAAEFEPQGVDQEDVDTEPATMDEADDDVLLSWQNQEQAGVHHASQWYIIMGCIAAAAIVAAIFLKSWFFLPLGLLVPIALTKYSSRGTDAHSYELTTFTVSIDGKHYPYDAFKSFFEVENNGTPVFELIPTKRFAVLITLHATAEVADDIAEILGSVLPESEPEGYLGESIFKRLKF